MIMGITINHHNGDHNFSPEKINTPIQNLLYNIGSYLNKPMKFQIYNGATPDVH